ncbi:MAG: beta-galactosidase [Frankiales bacterium]|nr:beta-galactosidase [Frankiales bacterium]
MAQWPSRPADALVFGADYNPEQWPRSVWREDMALMREAGVNLVNLGIFSWAQVQPAADEWDWDWLDEILDLLHENGIAVDLGTGTSSPPPWLTTLHPEILPVTADGRTISPGARQHWRHSSPVFRRYALDHVRTLAARYAGHPALALWHVNNELGCHNIDDFSEDAAAAFRSWLQTRYGDLEALNLAWGTAFWSQRYSAWQQILPPRLAANFPNPTQQLDYKRFSSWAFQDYLRAEVHLLRSVTPDIPITTNFMVMGNGVNGMDYPAWAGEVDLVANDHYLIAARPDAYQELCFSANLTRGIAGGEPWFLMEHSTSAVNWQPVNPPKSPGQLRRDSLTHVAYGSDAVSFFQWRASAAGAEKFHSAMVPHAGADSQLFRDVCALGADVGALAEVLGTQAIPSQVAIVFDWTSWWASELDSHPSNLLRYREIALACHHAFQAVGIDVDVQPLGADLSPYTLVVAPLLYVVDAATRDRLTGFVEGGGHVVTTFFSGIVDENDHVHLGGYPGALRDLLGIRVEELGPLLPGVEIALSGGGTASTWADRISLVDAKPVLSYADGTAAVTRRTVGSGSASYVGALLDPASLQRVVSELSSLAGVTASVERSVVRRVRGDGERRFVFLINQSIEPRSASTQPGVDLLTGRQVSGTIELEPFGVAVIRLD